MMEVVGGEGAICHTAEQISQAVSVALGKIGQTTGAGLATIFSRR